MNNDNGGPAFPTTKPDPWNKPITDGGMTLRDYFAAKAMQGILSDQATISAFNEVGGRELVEPACLVATSAYAMADAMLKERAK